MNEENLVPMNQAKACFSRLSWAMIANILIVLLLQVVLVTIGEVLVRMGIDVLNRPWFSWVVGLITQYLVGVPLFLLMFRGIPVVEQSQSKLGGGNFWALLLMCFPVMYVGNIVGTFLAGLLSGGTAQNVVETYVFEGGLFNLFTAVVLAPLVEEFIFRKQLLDRCSRYGEKTAMVFSALLFALFHMNLFQFFYAFGMGLIFAYVYLRTRRLRYPILMHMVVNFMGSAVPLWVVSNLDLDALSNLNPQNLDQETHLPGLCGSAAGAGHCGPGDWHCYAKVLHPSARPRGAAPGGESQDGVRQCGLYFVCYPVRCGLSPHPITIKMMFL